MEIVKFRTEHFQALAMGAAPGQRDAYGLPHFTSYLRLAEAHPSFSVIESGEVLGCGGIIVGWPGVGEAWIFINENVRSHPIKIYKGIKLLKQNLTRIEEENHLHRVQAVVHTRSLKGLKLVEHLGFRLEAVLNGYGSDKSDFFMYAKVTK